MAAAGSDADAGTGTDVDADTVGNVGAAADDASGCAAGELHLHFYVIAVYVIVTWSVVVPLLIYHRWLTVVLLSLLLLPFPLHQVFVKFPWMTLDCHPVALV